MTSPAELHEHLCETSPGKLLLHMPSMPVPNIKMDISEATYITLLNGHEKCQQTFWWRFMDPYARTLLRDAAAASEISAPSGHGAIANGNVQLDQASTSVEEWTAPHEAEWRQRLNQQLEAFRDERLKDGPRDERLVTLDQVHLGCFWAVSHLVSEYEALVARTSDIIAQTRQTLQGVSAGAHVPVQLHPEPVEAEIVRHSLQRASVAFNAVQLDITSHIAQKRKTGFESGMTVALTHEWEMEKGAGRGIHTENNPDVETVSEYEAEEPEMREARGKHTQTETDFRLFIIRIRKGTNNSRVIAVGLLTPATNVIYSLSKEKIRDRYCGQAVQYHPRRQVHD